MNGSNISGGETLGVWGSELSSSNEGQSTMTSTAIQKSWALEFDEQRNGYKDLDGRAKSPRGNAFDTYFGDVNGTGGRSINDQHTGWNYPDDPNAYNQIKSGTYQLLHNGIENLDLSGLVKPASSWHHVMIDYTPPAVKGGDAVLKYSFNTKDVTGRKKNTAGSNVPGQELVYQTVSDLHTERFKLNDSNKLRFGFTASTGYSERYDNIAYTINPGTTWIVFESIPAVVQAEISAYAIDETTKSRIDNNASNTPNIVEEDDKGLSITSKVHPNDDLTFKYLLQYQDGQQSLKDANATINLPSNVTFGSTDDSNVIGKVIYTSVDGSKTTEEPISKSDIDENNVLHHKLLPLNNDGGSDLTYAKIELYATANIIPSDVSTLSVPVSHVNYTAANFIADDETDKFTIVEPSDTLTIATDQSKFDSKVDESVNFAGTMSFESKKDINNNDMDIYYTVNGKKYRTGIDTGSPNGQYSIPITTSEANGFKVGDNKVVVQVVDTKYKTSSGGIETIASNKLEYTVNVTDVSLIITPDEQTRTVTDNGKQTISGTIKLSDNSELGTFDNKRTGYGLTDGNKTIQTWEEVIDGNENFEFEYTNDEHTEIRYKLLINPIGMHSGKTKGLTVGENSLDFTFGIGSKDSNPVKFYEGDVIYKINVPDIDITLDNSGNEDVTALSGQDFFLPAKLNYKDNPNYQYDLSSMDRVVTLDVVKRTIRLESKSNWLSGETELIGKTNLFDFSGFDYKKDNFEASYYVTDPYLRESNTLHYNVERIKNYTKLTTADSYQFEAHNAAPDIKELVGRKGDWGISVYSYNSPWVLTASSSNMVRSTEDGGEAIVLDGDVVFVDPKDESNIKNMNIGSDGDPAVIDEQTASSTTTKNVSGAWSDENGVLLDLNGALVGGSYSGTINWNLTNSI